MTVRPTNPFAIRGGLVQDRPALEIGPGHAIASKNYEPVEKGHRRWDGFERLDGRPKPSDASYWYLAYDAGSALILEGQTVTGGTSAATGIATVEMEVASGDLGAGTGVGYVILHGVSGTFVDNENLQVGGVTKAVLNGQANQRGAPDTDDDELWRRAAIEETRDAILVVPGEGPVRGVFTFEGAHYAIRNAVGGATGAMYKATTAGWVLQALGRSLTFTSGGTYEPAVGDTITGATSGATAVLTKIIETTGDWTTGDQAGRFIFASQTGTFQAENLNVGANLNMATIAADSTANTLPAGGYYKVIDHNFYGASDLNCAYAVSGVGRAFEWNGTVFAFIITGMSSDYPTNIAEVNNQLGLTFAGGSFQNSSPGNPHSWSAVLGATEIGIGEDVGDLLPGYAQVLMLLGRKRLHVLYGDDRDNFDLQTGNGQAGGYPKTMQLVTKPVYVDDFGVRDARSTPTYGNFAIGSLSGHIATFFKAKKKAGVSPIQSSVCKDKGQYRVYFSDGTALFGYFGRKMAEFLPLDLGKVVRCIHVGRDSDNNEVTLFGSDDGYVYQMDVGTSFDGTAIEAYCRLAFNHIGSPTQMKAWKKVTLEVDARPSVTLGILAEVSYGSGNSPPASQQNLTVEAGGGFWNVDNWDDFYWSSPVEGRAYAKIGAKGENISIAVVSESAYEEPHILHGCIFHYSPRKVIR